MFKLPFLRAKFKDLKKPSTSSPMHVKQARPAMHRCERNLSRMTVRTSVMSVALLLLLLIAAYPNTARSQASKSIEPHTPDAVIAADQAWDEAETSANTNYIDALLLPEYRSVSSDGSTHDKAAILASARKNAGSTERAAAADKWRAAHPHHTSVHLIGDTAILTFTLDKPGPKPVMSCDIFVYREGHWHAIYSQHTEAGK